MANTRKTTVNNEVSKDEEKEVIKSEAIEVDTEKEALKEQVALMQKQLEQFTKMFEKMQNMPEKEIEEKEEKHTEIIEINPNRRVKVMNMVHAGGTYSNGKTSIRFDQFGDVRNIRYEDLEDFRYGKYSPWFENLELRILEKDVVSNLNLDSFYEKYDISREQMKKIITLPHTKMMEEVEKLTKPLQISFASLFVEEASNGNQHCSDVYKWKVFQEYFKIENFSELLMKVKGV